MKQTVAAHLKYLRITPRKTRYVANLIRGMMVPEAEAQLMLLPRRASQPILKLLRSAMANARVNAKLDPDTLIIKEIRVDSGPKLKRFMPRSRGSAYRIEKKMSHVTIILDAPSKSPAVSRFVIQRISRAEREKAKRKAENEKSKGNKAKEKSAASHSESLSVKEEKDVKNEKIKSSAKEPGVFKKVFRRKSV